MSKRERHERDTWIDAGCLPKGNKKIWNTYMRKKLIDMKNLLVIKEEIKS